MELMTLQVASKDVLAEDVVSVKLVDPAGHLLPEWSAGAHLDIYIRGNNGERLVRQYSLCSDPEDRRSYRLGVLREVDSRGGSLFVHDHLQIGQQIQTSAPRNNFELLPATAYIFIAGGIGITPIIPMLKQAEGEGSDWFLHYGGRTRNSMAFIDDLGANNERVSLVPQDEFGYMDLPRILEDVASGTLIYCCGPEPMLEAIEALSEALPNVDLHMERFANPIGTDRSAARSFEVEMSVLGKTVTVEPGVSILEAVNASGACVPFSCREGTCGTCETLVLDGDVDHRDAVLTDAEKAESEVMMICVSRCNSERLTLEL